jgi:hypothetical protein
MKARAQSTKAKAQASKPNAQSSHAIGPVRRAVLALLLAAASLIGLAYGANSTMKAEVRLWAVGMVFFTAGAIAMGIRSATDPKLRKQRVGALFVRSGLFVKFIGDYQRHFGNDLSVRMLGFGFSFLLAAMVVALVKQLL